MITLIFRAGTLTRGREVPSAARDSGRFSFCNPVGGAERTSYGVDAAAGGCTGKLMGLGRVLAPRFQPCPLSVGGTAPSAALVLFGLGLGRGRRATGQDRRRPLHRRVSRSENRECLIRSERARVDHFCEYARARRSRARRRPIFFLRIRLAAPSAASYGVDVAAGGLTGKLMARVDHFCELRARARRSRARCRPPFFCECGGAERSELRGRCRRLAGCTGKLMGLGRVLAPRFRACPLSVGGWRRAPRRILSNNRKQGDC